MAETIYLSLGSNLGDRESFLRQAVHLLSSMTGLKLLARSSVYKSAPIDCPEGTPDFLNMVVKMDCTLAPEQLLDGAERLEREMGREHKNGTCSRVIDIDIILFGERIFNNDRLTIPHPRMAQRAFVLIPLCEISPRLTEPTSGAALSDLLGAIGSQGVTRHKANTHV